MQPITIQKDMQITSPVFTNNSPLPVLYTCHGKSINPPLVFHTVPDKTRSMVLIVDDPDAPAGLFVHWVVFNIPPDVRTIAENSYPLGSVEAVSSYGKAGYGSPCPPTGTGSHRYTFKLYALDIVLTLTPNVKAADVEGAMMGHVLASAQLIGLYPGK